MLVSVCLYATQRLGEKQQIQPNPGRNRKRHPEGLAGDMDEVGSAHNNTLNRQQICW